MVTRTKKMLPPKPGKEHLLIKSGAKSIGEALAGMKGGESRTGFLGDGNIVRKPDYEPIPESPQDVKLKRAIQQLLVSIIEPNPLSNKSTNEADKRSLVRKLSKTARNDLIRFLPERLKNMAPEELAIVEVSEGEKAEIQDLYLEISP